MPESLFLGVIWCKLRVGIYFSLDKCETRVLILE